MPGELLINTIFQEYKNSLAHYVEHMKKLRVVWNFCTLLYYWILWKMILKKNGNGSVPWKQHNRTQLIQNKTE